MLEASICRIWNVQRSGVIILGLLDVDSVRSPKDDRFGDNIEGDSECGWLGYLVWVVEIGNFVGSK